MAYIGLISDTHGYFDDRLRKFLEPVDTIWHAGDFATLESALEIAAFKPLVGCTAIAMDMISAVTILICSLWR